ncbi:MAG: hypothetical protein QNJ78_06040 [Gammaproteobacteria bacterium]|nr:hypothetical protein [Gammaproteobacteria bacterium]
MTQAGTEGKEFDRLAADIESLNPETLRATLVSSVGNHCEVWRTSKRNPGTEEQSPYTEFVIKHPLIHYSETEIRLLNRQYRMLKENLEDIIPDALFFITHINGRRSVCVLARAVNIWFNIANPQNREEAIALLSKNSKALSQLKRFVALTKSLRQSDNPKLIDLYGLDNLVLDTNREIRYIDSFDVFFFEDMQHLFDANDPELDMKIKISRDRLKYLEQIISKAETNRQIANQNAGPDAHR